MVSSSGVVGVSRTSILPVRQTVGILDVDLSNTVKGLQAQAYLPNRNPKSPTAIRFNIPKYDPTKAKAGTVDIWVEGRKLSVKVGKTNLNEANVAGYVAAEFAKEIRKLGDDYLVELKPTKVGMAAGAQSTSEITIWKKGKTAPSPAYDLFENGNRTPVARPAKLTYRSPSMDITPNAELEGIQRRLITVGKETYLTEVGPGGPAFYKLTPKP